MIHFDKDEIIVKEIRGPRTAILLRVIITAVLAVLPLILLGVVPPSVFSFITVQGNERSFFIFMYSLWLLLVWVDFFVWWMRYCLHTLVLTDSRMFDLTKRTFFNRNILSVRLEDIEEIKINYKNNLKRFAHIGKLIVITSGSMYPTREIVFDNVFEPEAIRELIQRTRDARREKLSTVTYSAELV